MTLDNTPSVVFANGQNERSFPLVSNREMKIEKCQPKSLFKESLGTIPKYGYNLLYCSGAGDFLFDRENVLSPYLSFLCNINT